MKKILAILLFTPFAAFSQSCQWISHNDSLFVKCGTDSTHVTEWTFYLLAGKMYNGLAGQVLKKNSNNPGDYSWGTMAGGGDLLAANNLSDVTNVTTARSNLGLVIGTNVLAPNGNGSALTSMTAGQVGLGNVTNESKATMFTSPTFTGTIQTFNQNTTGTAAGLSAPLSFANGGNTGSAATSATTGAMTVSMTTSVITITPTGACTFNASGGVTGQLITFAITTSGTTSFVLTFGTNFRKVGTLATGTTSARFFSVTFRCINGTIWQEIGRTAAQT